MPIKYKIDVLAELKAKGYNTTRLRTEHIFGERVIQQFRDGIPASWAVIEKLCSLLDCDVGDIVQYQKEERAQP